MVSYKCIWHTGSVEVDLLLQRSLEFMEQERCSDNFWSSLIRAVVKGRFVENCLLVASRATSGGCLHGQWIHAYFQA
jgi:hypothetical protein